MFLFSPNKRKAAKDIPPSTKAILLKKLTMTDLQYCFSNFLHNLKLLHKTQKKLSKSFRAGHSCETAQKDMNDSWFVCLFDLILYVPSTIFQLNKDGTSWVEPVLSYDKCVLLKDHNAVTPVRLAPTAARSRVKHSTTEPLHSL